MLLGTATNRGRHRSWINSRPPTETKVASTIYHHLDSGFGARDFYHRNPMIFVTGNILVVLLSVIPGGVMWASFIQIESRLESFLESEFRKSSADNVEHSQRLSSLPVYCTVLAHLRFWAHSKRWLARRLATLTKSGLDGIASVAFHLLLGLGCSSPHFPFWRIKVALRSEPLCLRLI